MFIDASALVAILGDEVDAAAFAASVETSEAPCVSEFVVMETGLALMRIWRSPADSVHGRILRFLRLHGVRSVPLTPDMVLVALKAWETYGKGRGHPAQLNMGDCLSYAAAKVLGLPLLFKGEDFTLTDIRDARAA